MATIVQTVTTQQRIQIYNSSLDKITRRLQLWNGRVKGLIVASFEGLKKDLLQNWVLTPITQTNGTDGISFSDIPRPSAFNLGQRNLAIKGPEILFTINDYGLVRVDMYSPFIDGLQKPFKKRWLKTSNQ